MVIAAAQGSKEKNAGGLLRLRLDDETGHLGLQPIPRFGVSIRSRPPNLDEKEATASHTGLNCSYFELEPLKGGPRTINMPKNVTQKAPALNAGEEPWSTADLFVADQGC